MTDVEDEMGGSAIEKGMLPSQFMRKRRPECYSDSDQKIGYELDPKLLAYTLDTLSTRNEHQDFEIFARKLCERTICPQLRPATGPEGGGDGKAGVVGGEGDAWAVAKARAKNIKLPPH